MKLNQQKLLAQVLVKLQKNKAKKKRNESSSDSDSEEDSSEDEFERDMNRLKKDIFRAIDSLFWVIKKYGNNRENKKKRKK